MDTIASVFLYGVGVLFYLSPFIIGYFAVKLIFWYFESDEHRQQRIEADRAHRIEVRRNGIRNLVIFTVVMGIAVIFIIIKVNIFG